MTAVGNHLYRQHSYSDQIKRATIVGETRGTWIVDEVSPNLRTAKDNVNKKTLLTPKSRDGFALQYYTWKQLQEKLFCDMHARNIASAVSVCRDESKLRAIAAIIGKTI